MKKFIFMSALILGGCDLDGGVSDCKDKIRQMAVSPSSVEFLDVKEVSSERTSIGRDAVYEITFDAKNRMGVPLRGIARCDVAIFDSGRPTASSIIRLTDHLGNPL